MAPEDMEKTTFMTSRALSATRKMVTGRNNDAIADVLRMLAGSLGQIPQVNVGNRNGVNDECLALGKFQRNNPPIFEEEHEPDKAPTWFRRLRRSFDKGNGTVAEYAAKFQELIKYCPHYNIMNVERSKCLKFVNGLRHDIKKAIGYQQITRFVELVNKNQIYDEDSRESASHYKAMGDKKGKGQYRMMIRRNIVMAES
ncbi:uncharacterized protein LOC131604673 [Vicia villosa]|uniref:uncharacterized protein LOC131604673 n=1 Tax=Vicia villosa TaxID=3911 RepID=UPI00273B26D9|nr:uncharacterized protein LOC131604673 [Vicia villosa]